MPLDRGQSGSVGEADGVGERPDAGDLGLDDVAVGEVGRWGHRHPDTAGGAGEDDVAGAQDGEGRGVGQQVGAVEDEGAGVAALPLDAVDPAEHVDPGLRVDRVGRDDDRADRGGGVPRLALEPLQRPALPSRTEMSLATV